MTSLMKPEDGREVNAVGDKTGTARRKRTLRTIAVAAVVLTADVLTLKWVVPWADEMTDNPFMSLGYIVTFFVVFINFIILFALVAYLPSQESYPSDRWK